MIHQKRQEEIHKKHKEGNKLNQLGTGITPIGAVSRAATGMKMQSNGQGTSWGLVMRCPGTYLQHS